MGKPVYDLIIIGEGPAGLTSGLYARRSRLNTLLIERLIRESSPPKVRQNKIWQISPAVGDGATAVFSAERYLEAP